MESKIRDNLIHVLDLIEPGLVFVDKERFLSNPVGTRGFVDIVARDASGRWALIELKRSDASSREALHEILKYIEGFKENTSVREDEIRVLVVSTEWRELLVPFSSFVQRVNFNVAGYLLTVDQDYKPVSAVQVVPLHVQGERLFAPWHELNLYRDMDSFSRGLVSYESACREKGIGDYVLVELSPHPGHREREISAVVAVHEDMRRRGLIERPLTSEEIEGELDVFVRMLYFAPVMLENSMCLAGIERLGSPDELDELRDVVGDLEGAALTCALHERLYSVGSFVHRDFFEIGYPAKFACKLLDDEGWVIERIHRYGGVRANQLLEDETIVRELRGDGGATGQKYRRSISLGNVAEVSSLRREIAEGFSGSPQLVGQLLHCVEDALRLGLGARLDVDVFLPGFVTLSLYKAVTEQEGVLYVPYCTLAVMDGDERARMLYFLYLTPNGKKPSARQLIDDFYDGEPLQLLFALQWGGYESRDAEICEEIGLSYEVARHDPASVTSCRLNNFRWVPFEFHGIHWGFYKFINDNPEFTIDIVELYAQHWNGSILFASRETEITFRT